MAKFEFIPRDEFLYKENLHYVMAYDSIQSRATLSRFIRMHTDFYNHLNAVYSHLLEKYGKVWCPIDSESAEDIETRLTRDDLYKKIIFVADNLNNQAGAIFDKSTDLLRICCAIRTKNGYVIIREIYFDINPAILIPFVNTSKSTTNSTTTSQIVFPFEKHEYWGLIYQDEKAGMPFGIDKVLELLSGNGDEKRIVFHIEETKSIQRNNLIDPYIIYSRFLFQNIDFNDDIGKCFNGFSKSSHLLNDSISENLLKESYPLTGTAYYAPYSKKSGIYCVLYAQLDNPHDSNAVKVLRWFPGNKNVIDPISHSLYELGFIARDSNIELHNEMCRSGNSFLFGKIERSKVKIIGNAKEFSRSGKLGDYCLPYVLFKYIQ